MKRNSHARCNCFAGYAAGRKQTDALWTKHATERAAHYLTLLKHPELPIPPIVWVDRRTTYLGRCILRGDVLRAHVQQGAPLNTTIELQRAILGDERTFERTLAHEICHHVEWMTADLLTLKSVLNGFEKASHGARFRELGARINAAVGDPRFVTEKSDESDKLSETEKPYWLLIRPTDFISPIATAKRLGWAWAVRLDATKKMQLRTIVEQDRAIVVETRDRYWSLGKAKIGHASIAIPADAHRQAQLLDIVRTTPKEWSLALLRPRLGEELPPAPARR